MEKTQEAYNEMSKKKYEFEEKLSEFNKAKDQYKDVLMDDTIDKILTVQKEDGKLTERDLKIFISELSNRLKQLYSINQ